MTTLDQDYTITINPAAAGLSGGTIHQTSYNNSQTVLTNSLAAFGGSPGYSYQWQRKQGAGAYADVSGATGLSFSDTGLNSNQAYTYSRKATDSIGNTAVSNEITFTTRLLDPGVIAFSSKSDTTAVFSNAAGASNGTPTYAYQWYRSANGGADYSAISGKTATDLSDSGLTAGTLYYYKRRVQDSSPQLGFGAAYSNVVSVTTDGTPPDIIHGIFTGGTIGVASVTNDTAVIESVVPAAIS